MTDTDSGSSSAGVVNRRSVSRYDLILAVIPIALLGAPLFSWLFGAGIEVGLLVGAVVVGFALADGIFLNPPRGPKSGDRAA